MALTPYRSAADLGAQFRHLRERTTSGDEFSQSAGFLGGQPLHNAGRWGQRAGCRGRSRHGRNRGDWWAIGPPPNPIGL